MSTPSTKPIYSIPALSRGLRTLNTLWARELTPIQVKTHWFFTWYLLHDADYAAAAKTLGVERQTLLHFAHTFLQVRRFKPLKNIWLSLKSQQPPSISFDRLFLLFWTQTGYGFELSPTENSDLIGLWKTGFPAFMLNPSFILWILRSERKPIESIQTNKKITLKKTRHLDEPHAQRDLNKNISRVLLKKRWTIKALEGRIYLWKRNPDYVNHWLGPLKPRIEEWSKGPYKGRPKKHQNPTQRHKDAKKG